MTAMTIDNRRTTNLLLDILKWTARAASLASLAILAAFAFGEGGAPTLRQAVLMVFFPFGLVGGLVLGWWRETWGGALALASLAAFYVLEVAMSGRFPGGPYFAILASPGLLFLASGLLRRRFADHR